MNNDIKALSNMSISELKQLLSCVNQDIQSIKKQKQREKIVKINNEISELQECNNIAKRFTKTVIIDNIQNKKIKQDIQIQKDILNFIQAGGHIITAKQNKKHKLTTFKQIIR